MKLILFLIALFILGCVLYGIYCGVAAIVRSATLCGHSPNAQISTPQRENQPSPLVRVSAFTVSTTISELQALHALRQSGALTDAEFEQLKKRLLTKASK